VAGDLTVSLLTCFVDIVSNDSWHSIVFFVFSFVLCYICYMQGDHLNLKMSGNLTAVREMSGILLKIRELSGKNYVREKLPKTVHCKLHICPYRYLVGVCCVLNVKYMVFDHVLLHSYPHH